LPIDTGRLDESISGGVRASPLVSPGTMGAVESMNTTRTSLSIVVPIFNEEENLLELRTRLVALVDKLGFQSAEVLLVSDGSVDGSEQMIWDFCQQDPLFKGIFLTRNFGHQAAVSIGLAQSSGDLVAVMDGDLQDPPEAIELLLNAIESGADVAYGVRQARKEPILVRIAYASFYRILKRVSSIEIPLDSGDFCVMRRNVVEAMHRLPERARFIRGIRAWVGFRQVGVPYQRAARSAGAPKYTLWKRMGLAYDGLFSFSGLPIRVMQVLGGTIACFSLLAAIVGSVWALWSRGAWPSWSVTLVISIWFLGGVQLLFMGLVGEYVHRTLNEVRQRPVALVRQVVVNPGDSSVIREGRGRSYPELYRRHGS